MKKLIKKEIDIVNIDNKIRCNFEVEKKNIVEYMKKLEYMKKIDMNSIPIGTVQDLKRNISELESKISNIRDNIDYNLYILESDHLISEYKELLKKPIVIDFLGMKKMDDISKENKKRLTTEFIYIAKRYFPNIENEKNSASLKTIIVCSCGNKDQFEVVEEYMYICQDCGIQQNTIANITSYKDVDRVNMSSKYSYDRKVHFKECMNQYQGKQNTTINPKVYEQLEEEFRKHRLLIEGNGINIDVKFSKITKEHITMFLKELGLSKHYENINLIYYNLTGIKPDDISHLEELLLKDFDILTEIYDKKYKKRIDRTNFINTQYVLYQLLQKHKHPCRKEDFVMLKTIERQNFHDEIAKECFEELGWIHTPLF